MRQRNSPQWVLGEIPQVPREKIEREIADAKMIIQGWKRSYMKIAEEIGGGEFLCEEYRDEIQEFASPYLYRMVMCGFITREEYVEFMRFCEGQVEELRDHIRRIEEKLGG